MDKKLSPVEEQKLTSAVERAATLANANAQLDRDALLATSLSEAGVSSRLAKTAAAAFNRRITVLTFQKTADEHKPDSFPLCNGDTVYRLMGGKELHKSASQTNPQPASFRIFLESSGEMHKAAGAKEVPHAKPLEQRLTWGKFEKHLESMMQKQADEHSKLIGELNKLHHSIQDRRAKLGEELTKSASFVQQTLFNIHGQDLLDSLGDAYKPSIRLRKTANAVDPETRLSKGIVSLMKDINHYDSLYNAVADYQEGLSEFSKTAAMMSSGIHKAAAGALTSALHYGTAVVPYAVDKLGQGFTGVSNEFTKALNDAFEKAQEDAPKTKPSDVLTSSFLIKDRAQDRLMAWSDMSADPVLAQYPASQVFAATQKVMDMNPALESAGKRELLRAYVSQLLAQNNRAGTADLAQLATTLKADAGAAPSASQRAAAVAELLQEVGGKPGLKVSVRETPTYSPSGDRIGGVAKAIEEDYNRKAREQDARDKAKAKELENAEKVTKLEEQAQKDAEKALEEARVGKISRMGRVTRFMTDLGYKQQNPTQLGEKVQYVAQLPGPNNTPVILSFAEAEELMNKALL